MTASSMAGAYDAWLSSRTASLLLKYTHYASPAILFLIFMTAFIARSVANTNKHDELKPLVTQTGPGGKPLPRGTSPAADREILKYEAVDFTPGRKWLFVVISILLLLTFVGNAVIVITHALADRKQQWWCGQAFVIYVVATFFVYILVFISIIDTHPSPNYAHVITWSVSLPLELLCAGSSIALYSSIHRENKAFDPDGGPVRDGFTAWETLEVLVDLSRVACLVILLCFFSLFVLLKYKPPWLSLRPSSGSADERTRLLGDHAKFHGTDDVGGQEDPDAEAQNEATAGWERRDKLPARTWWEYVRGYSLFFPYLWPAKSRQLKIIVIVCVALLVLGRLVNIAVPFQVGRIIDALAGENGHTPHVPVLQVGLFIIFKLLQGQSGIIHNVRSALWIPIEQYSYRELSVAAFEHVHSLSLDFHIGKKTGEVMSALSKGSSINNFLEQVSFQFLPMFFDLGAAIVYFIIEFDVYYALIVALICVSYMYLTIRLAQWRSDLKRQVTNLNRNEEAVKNDSLVSYESVKYFNAETFEFNRFRETVNQAQKAEYKLLMSLALMNVAQNLCFTAGLTAACFLAAFQISIRQHHVGKFAALLTIMNQLQQPLNYFGSFYRSIQTNMINSERMLELFKEQPRVVDQPGVGTLGACNGDVRFRKVSFGYDPRQTVVHGLDFHCLPGKLTALVGESGGGKSTVFRLLFRFYNILSGAIEIDGHNIEDISIDSVRRHIGVVPQDTVLFNETIMFNLKYANQNASDEQVYAACKAACIHHKILNWADGYESRVGERGLKLSGGEKQRIAIARTILKDPAIILLDEATAALDTETEQHIQEALTELSKNRTTIVIAHRLSTITHFDQILVVNEGTISERGTHEELIALDQKYAKMWSRQIRAQKAAEEAREATLKAKRLRKEASGHSSQDNSAAQSDEERPARRGRSSTLELNMTPARVADSDREAGSTPQSLP